MSFNSNIHNPCFGLLTDMIDAYIHEQMHILEENILLGPGAWFDQ